MMEIIDNINTFSKNMSIITHFARYGSGKQNIQRVKNAKHNRKF
jgi:hypothetical protein